MISRFQILLPDKKTQEAIRRSVEEAYAKQQEAHVLATKALKAIEALVL